MTYGGKAPLPAKDSLEAIPIRIVQSAEPPHILRAPYTPLCKLIHDMIDAMEVAITWTALGILASMSVSFLLFILSKIDKLSSDLTARMDQIVKDVGELKGDMKIVKDRLEQR